MSKLRQQMLWKKNSLFNYQADGEAVFTKKELDSIKIDDLGLFSVTNAEQATKMAIACAKVFHKLPNSQGRKPWITDGCACVGGNVFGFALSNLFYHVQSVEYDHNRKQMLESNVKILQKKCQTPVTVFEDSYLSAMTYLQQDIVFLDPPWGGTDYENGESVKLELGGKTVTDIIEYLKNLSHKNDTQLVFWKAPEKNYDEHDMHTQMSGLGLTMNEVPGFRKMKLFYVNLRETAAEANQTQSNQTRPGQTRPNHY